MKFFISIILLVSVTLLSYSQQEKVDVTYIANCGFLIKTNDNQLVVDALFKEGFQNYLVTPDTIASGIISSREPFDNVHLLLITHNHADHFSDSMVVKYLNYDPDNILVAPSSVIKEVLEHPYYKRNKNQIVKINKTYQDKIDTIIQGIRIKSFFLQHDNRPEIENYGYLIEMNGIKILHTGDCNGADTMQLKNLKLKKENIDLAFLNFYGFWEDKKSRDFLVNNIDPEEIVLMHIPPIEIESVKESVNKIRDFSDITLFVNTMDRKSFSFNSGNNSN